MDFTSNDHVFMIFKKLIEEKGLTVEAIDEEDIIHLSDGAKISLDNLRKEYEQVKEDYCIENFVEAITSSYELPGWEEARMSILPSLFPSDFDFGEHVNFPVTDEFNMIFVYDTPIHKIWINEEQLTSWTIDNEKLVKAAYVNLDRVLETAKLEIETVDDKKLGFFTLEDETLKSVLILAKGLKSKIEKEIGWPIIAVVPVRDFCYIFAENDFEFFAERVGDTVMNEYQNSAYPVTLELLKRDDDGIKAVGRFEMNDESDENDD